MKIQQLLLKAYGHFTDTALDFSGPENMHIIFGPNEAGKSTAMRALDCFFFDFGHLCPDAHIHAYKNLAVGALLETGSRELIQLTRFKRNKNSLLDAEGRPVDSQYMNSIMSGLTREIYSAMFGLDHQSLRLGAEEILKGGGHLGETIFSAASGLTTLRQALQAMEEQAGKLFAPRASTRPVNAQAAKIHTLRKEIQKKSIKPAQWDEARQRLDSLKASKKELEQETALLQTRIAANRRLQQALPDMAALSQVEASLRELEHVPELASDFSSRRAELVSSLNRMIIELDELHREESQAARQQEGLCINELILAAHEEIESLAAQIQSVQDSREQIQEIELEITGKQTLLEENLQILGITQEQAKTEFFRISEAAAGRIQSLNRKIADCERDILAINNQMNQARTKLHQIESELKNSPPGADMAVLDSVLSKTSQAKRLQESIRLGRQRTEELNLSLHRKLASLSLWNGDLQSFLTLSLPLPETIEAYRTRFARVDQDIHLARNKTADLEKSLEDRKNSLRSIDPQGIIPSHQDLLQARELRSQGWQLIRSLCFESKEQACCSESFLRKTGEADLKKGFEVSMQKADDLADQLIRHGDQAAARAGLQREIKQIQQALAKQKALEHSLTLEKKKIQDHWEQVWTPLSISPLSPEEMTAWLEKAREIRHLSQELDRETIILTQLLQEYDQLLQQALGVLADHGTRLSPEQDLEFVHEKLVRLRENEQKSASRIDTLRHQQSELQQEMTQLDSRLAQSRQKLQSLEKDRKQTLAELNIPAELNPDQSRDHMAVRQKIHNLLNDLQRLCEQQSRHQNKCRSFSRRTRSLIQRLEFIPEKQDNPEDAVSRLLALARKEHENSAALKNIEKQLEKIREKTRKLSREKLVLEKELAQMCSLAGVQDHEQLPDVEARSANRKELLTEKRHIRTRLQQLAAGENLDSFLTRAEACDPDQLQTDIQHMKQELDQKQSQLEDIKQDIFEADQTLSSMDGTSNILEMEDEIQEQRALLQDNVHEYLRLKVAAAVLQAATEEYAGAHQGPVLQKAGEAFRNITGNSFSRLVADYNHRGDPVIKAVRPSDFKLEVHQLSEGTRDQLFLALRLGGIYRYLENNQPFPLILDDILIHFDDQRSRQTLSELSRLSSSTQVLFFTHHSHLVELARGIPETGRLKIHEL
ncbi:MAG: AAA family ATPase [Desulfonatronovibrionaceae bacterium]